MIRKGNGLQKKAMDYNNIPKDVWEQCSLRKDPSSIIAKSVLVNFSNSNKLTLDTAYTQL